MAKIHICNFVEVRHWIVPDTSIQDNGTWQTPGALAKRKQLRNPFDDGHDWGFLSFIYNGATRTRTGDNIEPSLW